MGDRRAGRYGRRAGGGVAGGGVAGEFAGQLEDPVGDGAGPGVGQPDRGSRHRTGAGSGHAVVARRRIGVAGTGEYGGGDRAEEGGPEPGTQHRRDQRLP